MGRTPNRYLNVLVVRTYIPYCMHSVASILRTSVQSGSRVRSLLMLCPKTIREEDERILGEL